jgi:methionine biosynthesis protein MetW
MSALPHVEQLVTSLVQAGSRVFDVGCGDGRIGAFLQTHLHCTVVGLEIDANLAKTASQQISKVFMGNADDEEFLKSTIKASTFDVILASNILEHLKDPERIISILKKSLAGNGSFIVVLPNVAHWSIRLGLLKGEFRNQASGIIYKGHLHYYSLRGARELLEKDCGLSIRNETYEFYPLPLIPKLCSLIPFIGKAMLGTLHHRFPNFFAYQLIFLASPSDTAVKLVLGCGPLPLHPMHRRWVDETWTLTDLYPTDPEVKKMDIRAIPYPDASVSAIYASHVLEHISFRETGETLNEWHRVLKPGGTLTINVPDFEWACERFLANYRHGKPTGSRHFQRYTDFWEIFFGNHQSNGEVHKAGFTRKTLLSVLKRSRFRKIRVENTFDDHEMGVLVAQALR